MAGLPDSPALGPGGAPARWSHTVALAAVVGVLQLLAVFNPLTVEPDPEERFNAGHALALVSGHLSDLWRLQYREYCGGCTLDAVMGAALFTVLPPSWLVWKLVPIAFSVVLVTVGFRALHRQVGPPAALAFGLLVAFPPRAWLHLSLIAWGNHYEAGALAACVALLVAVPGGPRRAAAAGALAGICTWIGFSGAFAVVGGLGWLAWTRRWRDLRWFAAAVPLGLAPWLGQWLSSGVHPFVTIYEPGEALPDPWRIPRKLSTLLWPRQLVSLFGLPDPPLGWALGWGWAAAFGAATVLALRRGPLPAKVAVVFLAAWLAMYLVVRFQVYDPPWPEIAVPGSARYAAPLYPCAFVILASAVGAMWRRRRSWALALLVLPLAAGVAARIETFRAPFPVPVLARMKAVDLDYFRLQSSYVLPRADHAGCTSADPDARAWHAYALGRHDVAAATTAGADLSRLVPPSDLPMDSWLEGIGEELADDATGQGAAGIRVPEVAWSRAGLIPGLDDHQLTVVAGAAAWTRRQGDWIDTVNCHDSTAISRLRQELDTRPPTLADGVWWAAGRRWAHDVAGPGTPAPTVLPHGRRALPTAFVEGYGTGLGERWGPQVAIPMPQGLGEADAAALRRGYSAGVARGWLAAPGTAPPRLTGGG